MMECDDSRCCYIDLVGRGLGTTVSFSGTVLSTVSQSRPSPPCPRQGSLLILFSVRHAQLGWIWTWCFICSVGVFQMLLFKKKILFHFHERNLISYHFTATRLRAFVAYVTILWAGSFLLWNLRLDQFLATPSHFELLSVRYRLRYWRNMDWDRRPQGDTSGNEVLFKYVQ